MTPDDIGAATARLLIKAGAIQISRERPYVLAAGWASPVYVDCRLLIGEPQFRKEAVRLAAAAARGMIEPGSFDALAGAETAGIPFAAWLADALDMPLRYVRKRPLGIGHNAQVEGGSVEGLRVLLVDDLTTDGCAKLAESLGLPIGAYNACVSSPDTDARLAKDKHEFDQAAADIERKVAHVVTERRAAAHANAADRQCRFVAVELKRLLHLRRGRSLGDVEHDRMRLDPDRGHHLAETLQPAQIMQRAHRPHEISLALTTLDEAGAAQHVKRQSDRHPADVELGL